MAFKKQRQRKQRYIPRPKFKVRPGWEISFGKTGDRNRFLIEVLATVPDGAVIGIVGHVDAPDVERLEPFPAYWSPQKWFGPAALDVPISADSRPALESVIKGLDLTRQWDCIEIFKDETVFFDSYDNMYDGGPFVTSAVAPEKVRAWKESGIISEHDWFEPGMS